MILDEIFFMNQTYSFLHDFGSQYEILTQIMVLLLAPIFIHQSLVLKTIYHSLWAFTEMQHFFHFSSKGVQEWVRKEKIPI